MQQAVLLQAAHEVVALAGFHIKRQEFEPEYDNEAEMIVADMEFRDDDTEVGMHACTPLLWLMTRLIILMVIIMLMILIMIVIVVIVVPMTTITVTTMIVITMIIITMS